MATEKRLIDANALEAAFRETKMTAVFPNWLNMDILAKCAVIEYAKKVKDIVTNAPTVDAVEVVRCKDCEHFVRNSKVNTDRGDCYRYGIGCLRGKKIDDFCSYGDRRDNGCP